MKLFIGLRKISAVLVLLLIASCTTPSTLHRMSALLEKAEEMNINYVPMDTVSFMDEVLDFYMSHGNRDERLRANYMMGSVYRDRGDSPMALQYYLDAVSQEDTTRSDCDFKRLSRIYGQMAMLYKVQRYPQKEIEMLEKAIAMAEHTEDKMFCIASLYKIAGAYYILMDYNKALEFANKSYKLYVEAGENRMAAGALGLMIYYHLSMDSLEVAKEEIDEYISASGLYNNGSIEKGSESFYYFQGLYYDKIGKLDSALHYYNKLLLYPSNLMYLENGYKGLMTVYGKQHQTDSVLKYSQLYADANDTANIRNSANEISRAQMLYDYSEHQNLARKKSEENRILWDVIFVCLILMLVLSFAVYYYVHNKRNKIRQLNSQYSSALLEYASTVKELKMFKENSRLFEAEKMKEIENLKGTLSVYQNNSNVDLWDTEQDLLQHPVIQAMINHANKITAPSDSEWKDLLGLTEKLIPEFYKSLVENEASLSDKEIYVCILTRLHFLPSQIAALMNFSKQRVTNLRSSANKKLFGNNSTKYFDRCIRDL